MSTTRILLFALLILAAFLRLFSLQSIPPGLYPDEAMNGVDALRALDKADFKVFYPDNNGREGLFINLQALSVQIFGATPWALRVVSAVAGTLTVLFLYLLARELGTLLFQRKKDGQEEAPDYSKAYGLLAAFLLAVSEWHIHFSRIGFRAILLPLLSTAAFYFLLKALRTGSHGSVFWSGASFGLSLSTYIASRIVPVLIVPWLIVDFLKRKTKRRQFLLRWGVFAAAFLFVIFPLGAHYAIHPADFIGRAESVPIFSTPNPLQALLESTGKTLLMFHVLGDGNWRHNVAGSPALDRITGLFFLVGIVVTFRWLWRPEKRLPAFFLLLWFALLLLPVVATTEGIPHVLRAIGTLPAVMLLAAIGGTALWLYGKRFPDALRVGITIVALSFVLIANFQKYFLVWAGSPNVPDAFRSDLVDVARYLNDHPENTRYVIVNEDGVLLNGVPMPSATVRFLTEGDTEISYLTPEQISEIQPNFDKTVIVLTAAPSPDLDISLKALFPSIKKQKEGGTTLYRL